MNGQRRFGTGINRGFGLVAAAIGAALLVGACGSGAHGHGTTSNGPVSNNGSGSPTPAPNDTPAGSNGHGVRIEGAERWQTLTSPGGDYTIAAPEGWEILPPQSDAAGEVVAVAPAGQTEPMAYILALSPVSELAAEQSYPPDSLAYTDPQAWANQILQADFGARSKQWSAQEVAQGYAQMLASQGGRLVDVQASSNDLAQATVAYSPNGVPVDEQLAIQMHYEVNPAYTALAGQQMFDSFAFFTGCEAPTGTLDRFLPECASILGSFQPGNGFLMDAIAGYIQRQTQQVQAVGGTIDQIGQLQAESAALQQQTTFDVGVGWANVLGGQVDVRNPNNGDVYHLDDRFANYCLDQDGYVVGGNDPSELGDECATPLERFRPRG